MSVNLYIQKHKSDFDKAMDFLKSELKSIRTGRANTALIDAVLVEAYGTMQPLSNVASLSIPESNSIAIVPWDKTIMKDVEKALEKANLGLSIINTGEKVIAKMPLMTEETRKQMVKLLGQKVEESKVQIRQIRDKVKETITVAEKEKEVTEDDKYQYLAELDTFVSELNKVIEKLREEKEEEVMTV